MNQFSLSIEKTRKLQLKEVAKNWLGQSLATLAPVRAMELYRTPNPDQTNAFDRAVLFYLRQRALRENRLRFFDRLHQNTWAGQTGRVFSTNCDHRFEDLFLTHQQEDFAALSTLWQRMNVDRIIEIGTNSGLLLNFLTKHLGGVSSAIGIDINEEQILANKSASGFDKRIQFVHASGDEWIFENATPNTLFVTNGGVLEYFSRPRLNQLLTHIQERLAPAIFYTSEPVAADHDQDSVLQSIPFGKEHSFSHNYRNLFESNGFHIDHQREVWFDEWKMLATLANCK